MHNSKKMEKIGNKFSTQQMACYLLGSFMKRQNEVIAGGKGVTVATYTCSFAFISLSCIRIISQN